jgi:hypothetical protein
VAEVADVEDVEDAEVDREIIPGAAFANRAILVRVGLNKVRMKTTNTDFETNLGLGLALIAALF